MAEQTSPTTPAELPATMLAIDAPGGAASDPGSMVDVEIPTPVPRGHDLLVAVDAVSVNPVDVKNRGRAKKGDAPRVLGFDAVGRVVATGEDARRFAVGDRVFYAGQIDRAGSDAQFQLVNENIVGAAPESLTDAEAAAVPLTAITAWEALFDRLRLDADSEGTLLVIGAAGGVGSLIIQFARALTRLTVIAVASRPESEEWVTRMGADHVVGRDFADAVREIAPGGVDYVFTSFTPGNIDSGNFGDANGYYCYYKAEYNDGTKNYEMNGRIIIVAHEKALYQIRLTTPRNWYSYYNHLWRQVRSSIEYAE